MADKRVTPPSKDSGNSVLIWTALILAAVAAWVSYGNYRQIQKTVTNLESRIVGIELGVADIGKKVAQGGARGAAPQRPEGPDPDKVHTVKLDGAPTKGPLSASVTIVEVSDFECPFCSRAVDTLARVYDVYGDQVRFAWKNFPLAMHKNAPLAHMAAMAADDQGKFWEYHDTLFANQKKLQREDLIRYAEEVGLNLDKFVRDLDARTGQDRIAADMREANALGVQGTPAFFINGRFLSGARPFETFAAMINTELRRLGKPVPDEVSSL